MEKIFGYDWEQLKKAMQGNSQALHPIIKNKNEKIVITEEELELFKEVGIPGLEQKGFFGLIDRLNRAGITG